MRRSWVARYVGKRILSCRYWFIFSNISFVLLAVVTATVQCFLDPLAEERSNICELLVNSSLSRMQYGLWFLCSEIYETILKGNWEVFKKQLWQQQQQHLMTQHRRSKIFLDHFLTCDSFTVQQGAIKIWKLRHCFITCHANWLNLSQIT